MKHKILFFTGIFAFLFLFTANTESFAQKKVTGNVSSTDGLPLPGVSIIVKGTSTGTMSDSKGNYELQVPNQKNTLVFSFIGMKTQEMQITGDVINCVLEEDAVGVEEIVVIGYGTVKKEDATGSVTSVSSDDFNKGAITSPQDLLTGKTAGVQITSSGGAPGSGSTIRIRGGSSLSASNDPLIVIDGMPIDNGGVAGMRNPLNLVNPNDIETFTVLKDASATAIYGSRASNGVIIITTKKGKKGKPFKINYNGVFSYNTLAKKTSVLTADEFRKVVKERYGETDTAYQMLGNANTDWQNEIFQNSIGHDHNINFSGSTAFLPYRVSVGYSDQEGILKTGKLQRTTAAITLNPSLLDNHLNINFNVKGMNIDNHFANTGAIGAATMMDPTQEVNDSESKFGGYFTWITNEGKPNTLAPKNPVSLLMMNENVSNVKRILGNAQFDYKLHFFPDLKANLNVAYDYSSSTGYSKTPADAPFSYDEQNGGGYDGIYDEQKKNELIDFYLNYAKKFSSNKIEFMAGYSWQHFHIQGSSFGTNAAGTDTTNVLNDYITENYLVSFFGRLNYSYDDKYLLTFTLRNDGTSRFAPENRWGLFPAAAFAWNIKNEGFLKESSVFSAMKLRLGYGITGQQNIGVGDYPYLARYTYSQDGAYYLFDGDTIRTARPEGYNNRLKWEETTTYNAGLDFGFLRDKITASVDVYYRQTSDLLNVIPVPAGTNFTNLILSNIGDLENKGVEFSLSYRPIVTKDLFWELGFNITYNKGKITKLTATEDTTYLGVETGGISGGEGNNIQMHSVGYSPNTFFVYEQVYDNEGKPIEGLYVDRNGDGAITTDDKYYSENPAADIFLGFSSKLTYKNFDFSFSGRANFNNYVYNNVSSNTGIYVNTFHPTYYLLNLNSSVLDNNFEEAQYFSDHYIENASFMKIDNVSLGYTFNEIMQGRINMNISVTMQNVYTLTKYSGLDPEISYGIDNNIYPRPRVFLLGINLTFNHKSKSVY